MTSDELWYHDILQSFHNLSRICHAKSPTSLFPLFIYICQRSSATPEYQSNYYILFFLHMQWDNLGRPHPVRASLPTRKACQSLTTPVFKRTTFILHFVVSSWMLYYGLIVSLCCHPLLSDLLSISLFFCHFSFMPLSFSMYEEQSFHPFQFNGLLSNLGMQITLDCTLDCSGI